MSTPDDCVEILRRFNCWRRGDDTEVMIHPFEVGKAIDSAIAEIEQLRLIALAAKNLVEQRGRFNTETAYKRLAELFEKTKSKHEKS